MPNELIEQGRDPRPSVEQQVRELLRAGWSQYRIGIWVDPQGVMYRGPHRAWEIMRERKESRAK